MLINYNFNMSLLKFKMYMSRSVMSSEKLYDTDTKQEIKSGYL